jgi:hypothetical protein
VVQFEIHRAGDGVPGVMPLIALHSALYREQQFRFDFTGHFMAEL